MTDEQYFDAVEDLWLRAMSSSEYLRLDRAYQKVNHGDDDMKKWAWVEKRREEARDRIKKFLEPYHRQADALHEQWLRSQPACELGGEPCTKDTFAPCETCAERLSGEE